jgi:N6-adenosine-specific RNA methylase IME4
MDLPAGPFGCILADPPWGFRTFSGARVTPHRTEVDHYPTMTQRDMLALPVGDIAAKDCALFMWTIGSHLYAALALGAACGFNFKTDAFVCIKTKLINADQIDLFTGDVPEPRMSMGYWTRKGSETCLLFTRGKPRRLSKSVRQVIVEPAREHSRKPDCQYDRIETLVGGPRLEMFSRTSREGWQNWGRDVGKFDTELKGAA